MGSKQIGSRFTAFKLSQKLAKVSSGFELSYRDFKEPIRPVAFNNGAKGAFVVPCNKLVFTYCEKGGSSRGIVEYIKTELVDFAKRNPETVIQVKHKPWHHPTIEGHYNNGNTKTNVVANLEPRLVKLNAEGLHASQGGKDIDFRSKRVISANSSVRGIWSPFHCSPHKI